MADPIAHPDPAAEITRLKSDREKLMLCLATHGAAAAGMVSATSPEDGAAFRRAILGTLDDVIKPQDS